MKNGMIRTLSFIAFISFLASIIISGLFPSSPIGEYISIIFHLSAFLIVPRLYAYDWAKSAGYIWLGVDVIVSIMAINGVDHAITYPIRLGGHVFAAIWIAEVSRNGDGIVRSIGFLAGISLLGFSLIAPFVPAYLLLPVAGFVLAWFCVIGFKNGTVSKCVAN